MNIGWLKIIGATFFELMWVTGLKYAVLPIEWLVTILAILGSSYCLITAGNTLPVGTAYSVFVGLSAIGTILIEFLFFNLSPTFWQLFFMFTLILGIIGLKLINEKVER
ncbi:multidrug efflux SMR transporter [uncultured Megamonas sp.]|uniref:DMT family transporter n=1 Tax=uncultured Megamonas sp. TaxID=286140 RepID=UPI00266F2726|nr:SMR family transporter [uncultured Megamonas sp.]